jgi:glycosyltransferase involved in cell wall biosynthesis
LKISVVIPTYDPRAHVIRSIERVLAQTTPVSEIVVVDDGSTDGTAEAIRGRHGSRIAVSEQENAGVSAARNLLTRKIGKAMSLRPSIRRWFFDCL